MVCNTHSKIFKIEKHSHLHRDDIGILLALAHFSAILNILQQRCNERKTPECRHTDTKYYSFGFMNITKEVTLGTSLFCHDKTVKSRFEYYNTSSCEWMVVWGNSFTNPTPKNVIRHFRIYSAKHTKDLRPKIEKQLVSMDILLTFRKYI